MMTSFESDSKASICKSCSFCSLVLCVCSLVILIEKKAALFFMASFHEILFVFFFLNLHNLFYSIFFVVILLVQFFCF